MVDVYNEQIKELTKIIPDFKIANATIHFDEVSHHMHIVGVPVTTNCTRKRLFKLSLFCQQLSNKIFRIIEKKGKHKVSLFYF